MKRTAETDKELWNVVDKLADAATPIALRYFRTAEQALENKLTDGFDPVTLADRNIELAMRDILKELRPDDGVLGEEFDAVESESGLTWVLDPIDGTRSFICGTPTWGVLIALNDGQKPILGMIYQPFTGERFCGGAGRQALLHGDTQRELATRATDHLNEAIIFSTYPEIGTPEESAAFNALAAQCKLTRFGTDCYAYALLAAGQIDLVVEAGLNAYDIQAPIAVIESAGGIVTDWHGNTAQHGGQVIAAANETIHAQALAVLNQT